MNLRICLFQILAFAAFINSIYSQIISGDVVDKMDNPISFVNIGIVNGNRGAISDNTGAFRIDLRDIGQNDTLRFSSLGFCQKDFLISSIESDENLIVVLEKILYSLDEIVIQPSIRNIIEFGKKKKHSGGWAFSGIGEGFELAQFFANEKDVVLYNFMFHIRSTNFDSILFRINIYSDNQGKLGDKINKSQIYVTSNKKDWIVKDLSIYNIQLKNNFFISIEAIRGWGNSEELNEEIIMSGKLKKGLMYVKLASQGCWERSDGLLDYYLLAQELDL